MQRDVHELLPHLDSEDLFDRHRRRRGCFGGFANQKADTASNFATETVDLGMVVSDIDKSLKFYKDVIGFTEDAGLQGSSWQFVSTQVSQTSMELDVHVLVLGEGESATKLKLMQFKSAPRVLASTIPLFIRHTAIDI